jgi:glycine oxidase
LAKNHFDIIIVGGGLAGSAFALQCILQGKKILLIDEPNLSLSSKVAAGIWNPVVFKRLTKSYLVDELIPYLNTFYKQAEMLLQSNFIRDISIVKFLKEQHEIDFWHKKINSDMQPFLDELQLNQNYHPHIYNEAKAYGKVKQTGVLNTNVFMLSLHGYLKQNDMLLPQTFDFNDLHITKNEVQYKHISANKIVFCEGYLVKDNPYFSYIPMKPVKGETLIIECKEANITDIINKHLFILPLGEGQYKVGATFNWDDLNDTPSDNGIEKLETELKAILKLPFTILKKEAGVRPSVIDRRPILGSHPVYPNMGIFNGFGTKGVMLCPYLSEMFYNFMFHEKTLLIEVDIKRFETEYKISIK